MDIVVDTSVLIAVVSNETQRDRLIEVTRGAGLLSPASVHWEVGNALSAMISGDVNMIVYTYSQARQSFATGLEQAARDGEVRIKRKDGRVFVIQPAPRQESPLDVPGIDLGLTAAEILEFIREGRRPT